MFTGLIHWWLGRRLRRLEPKALLLPAPTEAGRRAARQATMERLRSPMREDDLVLGLETRLWLLRLPEPVRPTVLCQAYPRIANRLARDWAHADSTDACFDDLLEDRRGGRRGFPEPVLGELRRLRHFSVRHRDLIDREMRRHGFDRDTLPAPLLDESQPIDWTPTETIVVGARS